VRLRVLQITAADVLPEAALRARLAAIARLPPEARAGYAVQLRDPGLPSRALLALGGWLREETRALGAALWVNDRLDVALALGADGVHLGRRSVTVADARALLPPGTWISLACHAPAEVEEAAALGADGALLSPIFPSPGKGPAIGVEALREARARVRAGFPIVALGGVDAQNAGACFAAGATAAAAIRADLASVLLDALPRDC
jgi:thiamine-phosphate pyrophosphorylase